MKPLLKFLLFIIFITNYSIGQTKAECLNYIKLRDRIFLKDTWISTELKGNNLVITSWSPMKNGFKYVCTYNLKHVDAVEIEADEEYSGWTVTIYLDGKYYTQEAILRNGEKEDWVDTRDNMLYSRCKDKTDALKLKKYLIRLAVLNGSKIKA
jgi:hypothetical protein